MLYNRTFWKDHVTSDDGTVLQKGTLQSAGNFNNMEDGIEDVIYTVALITRMVRQLMKNSEVESYDVELKNTAKFPFSNATKTVSLSNVKSSKDYEVKCVCLNDNGLVGDIVVSDKLINGFKVTYNGCAASAKLKIFVTGGE